MAKKIAYIILVMLLLLFTGCPEPPQIFSITYHNLEGATNHPNNPADYNEESSTIQLADPTKNGYTFGGWFASEDLSGTAVTEIPQGSTGNKHFYAKWTANTYTVSFDVQGGSAVDPTTLDVVFDQAYGTLPVTVKDGYAYEWNTTANGTGTEVDADSIVAIASNHTLYAVWNPIEYSITYNLDSGENNINNPTAYTVESNTITFADPTKTGYTFNGWYEDAQFTTKVETVATGSTGNRTVFAKWTINEYSITFDKNGGTGTMDDQVVTYNASVTLTANAFTRNGYTFGGWALSAAGSVEYADQESYTMGAQNVTLYAIWNPIEYTITYNLYEGTNDYDNPVTYTFESNTITFADPTKTGYTFGGWYLEDQFTTEIETIAQGSTGNKTVFAKWTANSYTVILDKQGGTGGSDQVEPTFDAAMPDGALAPTRTGYDFGGYYSSPDGEGEQYYTADMVSADTWTTAENSTIYAKWTAKSYIVTLDFQEGTGGTSSVIAYYDQYVPAATPPSRTGYTFNGYFSQVNGGGKQYYGPQMEMMEKWDIDSAATLYAKWTINIYTITFNANGGTGTMDDQDITYHDTVPLIPNTFTRTGYSFDGWALAAIGLVAFEDQAQVTMSAGDVTLWAKWVPNTYTVTLDGQSGTGGSATVTATYDAAMPSGATAPTKAGYTFTGYYSAVNGGGTKYYNADMSSARTWNIPSSDITLYAAWTVNQYMVTFDENGGSVPEPHTKIVTFGQSYGNLATTSRTGYTFASWNTKSDGSGTSITDETVVDTPNHHTLYAQWTPNEYTVTFVGQEGTSPTPVSKTVTYDQSYGALATTTRTGYTFAGWNTKSDGSGDTVESATVMSTAADHSLFAQWTPNTYTITFDKEEGTGGSDTVTVTYDAAMPTATAPARTGYTFIGYFTAAVGTGTKYYNADMSSAKAWDIASDTTLYAAWELIDYTITYNNLNDGTNHPSNPATYTIENPTFSLEAPNRTGYDFSGWYATEEYTGDAITQILTGSHGNETFWAKWTPIVYDITYHLNEGTIDSPNPATYTIETATFEFNDPMRDYYDFVGWYANAELTGDPVGGLDKGSFGNVELWAKWTPTVYSITYTLDGGTNGSNPATYTVVTPTIIFAEPTRTGYNFNGWYDNAEFVGDAVTEIVIGSHGNAAFWAKWTPIVYDITYHLNDGTIDPPYPATYTIETATFALAEPSRDYYNFDGWYAAIDYSGSEVESIILGSYGDKDLYAKWVPIEYTITYTPYKDETLAANPAIYNIETPTFTLLDPTRQGYFFGGWHTESAPNPSFGSLVSEIPQGSHGDIILYQKWYGTLNVGDSSPTWDTIFIDRNDTSVSGIIGPYDYTEEDSWRYMWSCNMNNGSTTWKPSGGDSHQFNPAGSEEDPMLYGKIGDGKDSSHEVYVYYGFEAPYACRAAEEMNWGSKPWFLPSVREMQALAAYWIETSCGGLSADEIYWTSTDLDEDYAYAVRINTVGVEQFEVETLEHPKNASGIVHPIQRGCE